jgi:hypothetical protein
MRKIDEIEKRSAADSTAVVEITVTEMLHSQYIW